VRLQVQTTNAESAFQLLKRSIATEGVRSLWKGSVPAFSGALAENTVAFATNGFLTRLLAPFIEPGEEGQIHCKGPLLSGAVTGALTSVVLAPFDILKCRAQMAIAQGNASPRMSTTALNVFRAQGVRGFYVGYGAQLMREIPFFALFFGSYEISCQLLRKHTKMHDSTIYITSGGYVLMISLFQLSALLAVCIQIYMHALSINPSLFPQSRWTSRLGRYDGRRQRQVRDTNRHYPFIDQGHRTEYLRPERIGGFLRRTRRGAYSRFSGQCRAVCGL